MPVLTFFSPLNHYANRHFLSIQPAVVHFDRMQAIPYRFYIQPVDYPLWNPFYYLYLVLFSQKCLPIEVLKITKEYITR